MTVAFTGRREDPRLLTGAGKYTADKSLPGQVWAVFVRFDLAHTAIRGIETEAPREAEGVLAVLTGADMEAAGYGRGVTMMPFQGRDGALKVAKKPALLLDRVRYVGEPVVLVVAKTEAQARDAAELIELDLEALAVVADLEGGRRPKAPPRSMRTSPVTFALPWIFGETEAVEAAMQGAAHRVSICLSSERLIGNPMEPKAALANWDGDVVELWAPSQGISGLRAGLQAVTGIAPEQMRLHAEDVGGAFGVRGLIYPEYTAIVLAAKRTPPARAV